MPQTLPRRALSLLLSASLTAAALPPAAFAGGPTEKGTVVPPSRVVTVAPVDLPTIPAVQTDAVLPAADSRVVAEPDGTAPADAQAAQSRQLSILASAAAGMPVPMAPSVDPSAAAANDESVPGIDFDGSGRRPTGSNVVPTPLQPIADPAAFTASMKELLQGGKIPAAQAALRPLNPIDLAATWTRFTADERLVMFRLLSRGRSTQLFEELDEAHQQELLAELKEDHAVELLHGLDPASIGRLTRKLPDGRLQELIKIMTQSHQDAVQRFANYPASSVGALMRSSHNYLRLDPSWTKAHAMARVQSRTRVRHVQDTHLDNLMVVDRDGKLLGVVNLLTLVAAPGSMRVADLMNPHVDRLAPEQDQEVAVSLFVKYKKLRSAPVVAADGMLLGVAVRSDVWEAARQETEEDFAKMAGTQPGLLSKSVYSQAWLRLPFLAITLVGELGVSYLVSSYEPVIAHITALATFIPLISAMGGNVGSQTATLFVRALATGEIKEGETRLHIMKEIAVGQILGLSYGLILALAAFAFYGLSHGVMFPIIIGVAMTVSMSVAAIAGSVEPFICRRLGIDPATATGPIITCFTDLLSNIVYFSLAAYFLTH